MAGQCSGTLKLIGMHKAQFLPSGNFLLNKKDEDKHTVDWYQVMLALSEIVF